MQTIWKINPRVLWKCKAPCGCHEWFEQWQTEICAPVTLFEEYHDQFLCRPLWFQIRRLFISLVVWHVTSSLEVLWMTASSVATFGVTEKRSCNFTLCVSFAMQSVAYSCRWIDVSDCCVFWTSTTACCRLWKLLSIVCKTLLTQVFWCFCYCR